MAVEIGERADKSSLLVCSPGSAIAGTCLEKYGWPNASRYNRD